MTLENLDVKDIYVIGENLKVKIGEDLGTQFSGEKLVSWLLENDGQVSTREDGVKLGKYLVEYRVIQHVDEKYHFLDDNSRLYSFCSDSHDIYPRTVSQQQIWVQGLSIMRQFTRDIAGAKKRRTSWIKFNKGTQGNPNFKGKHLLEWLENNTDFESLEDCRRFLKSLLKLNFMRCNQNEFLRFDPSSEYWFYLTRLKEELPKTRKISKTLMPEGRKQSVHEKTPTEHLTRKQSVIGLTPDLIQQLTTFQSSSATGSGAEPRVERIKLKDTCVVLRSSLSRNSLSTSRSSLTQSSTSLSQRSQSSSALPTNHLATSTISLPSEIRTDNSFQRPASFSVPNEENIELNAQSYIMRLKEQYAVQPSDSRKSSSLSESRNDPTVSDLIASRDFQMKLQNIGKSSSQKNLKQVEEDRRAILYQLTERKYGRAIHEVISPSSSCPNNLDSLLKRDESTDSHATKSSGYGSIRGNCYSMTSLSRDSSCDDVTSSIENLSVAADAESLASSRDSICSTPTSQCGQPVGSSGTTELKQNQRQGTVTLESDVRSPDSDSESDKGSKCSDEGTGGDPDKAASDRDEKLNVSDPVPPPRHSLEREPLKSESDNEVSSVCRQMSSGAMNIQTATSARRARLTRTRAVSEGDCEAKST